MNFCEYPLLKQFIEENIDYIEVHDYSMLFSLAEKQLSTSFYCGKLAELLREVDPNVLEYFSRLPKGFYYRSDITSFVVPANITVLGTACFQDCQELQSITLHNHVRQIAALAFNQCTALKEIYIPASVQKIGSSAFSSCKQCVIKCEAESQPDTWHIKWNSAHCKVLWGQ